MSSYNNPESVERLLSAIFNDDAASIKQLCVADPLLKDTYIASNEKTTVLHKAVKDGKSEAVAALVEVGADVNATDIFSYPPLVYAAINNHIDIARFLLDHGARVDIADAKGHNALPYCVKDEALAQRLVERGMPLKRGSRTSEPVAVWHYIHGRKNLARLFLDNGAPVDEQDFFYNKTLLQHGVGRNDMDFVVELVEKYNANPGLKNDHGELPWQVAAAEGEVEMALFLRKAEDAYQEKQTALQEDQARQRHEKNLATLDRILKQRRKSGPGL